MNQRDFLLFRLSGLMSAYGGITVGERRSIWGEPSRSAVLGLLAAALGLTREDATAHQALSDGLGFGVRIDAAGAPLRDYHTANAPKNRKGLSWPTRKAELADRSNLYTILSERLYRLEAKATVVLWQKADPAPPLDQLARALQSPKFALYLGRKSCPLDQPPRPHIVQADDLLKALGAYDRLREPEDLQIRQVLHSRVTGQFRPRPESCPVWFEMDAGLVAEEAASAEIRQRRDTPEGRLQRAFSDRREGRMMWKTDPLEGLVT